MPFDTSHKCRRSLGRFHLPYLGATRPDAGAAISLQLEKLVGHCRGNVVELLLSPVSGSHSQPTDHRVSYSFTTPHSWQAADRLGWGARASQPPGVGVRTTTARTTVAGISSGLRPGTESGGVSVVALETARVAELLPARLRATKRSCSPCVTTHASPPRLGLRLLGASRTLPLVTILCETQ